MKTFIRSISLLLCTIVVLVSSCERKPLSEECICENKLTIPIDIDWTKCGIDPQNVSILFYNKEDGTLANEYIYEHNSNPIQSYAELGEGSYTAVIFNELRNQIDYISCKGHENLSTIKFEGNSDEPLRSRAETRSYIKQSGDLAVATIENIVVTKEMIVEAAYVKSISSNSKAANTTKISSKTKATVESLMDVVPLKKNTTIKIKAHINNIYYARMPSLVDLVNVADGYYVNGDKNSKTPTTLQFTMNNRTYDEGSFYNGTISTSITTFGTLTDRSSTSGHSSSTGIILDLLFKQINEEQSETSLEMDVTSLVKHTLQSDGSYLIDIDVAFSDPLPKVEPEGSEGDSGFGAEVENWEIVDIPLEQ